MQPNILAPADTTAVTTPAPSADPVRATPKVMALPEGTYYITTRLSAEGRQQIKGVTFPCVQLSSLPEPGRKALQFLTPDGLSTSTWISGSNGVAVLVTADSAPLLLTTLSLNGQLSSQISIGVQRLGDETVPATIDVRLVAHIQRMGDKVFAGGEWASAGDHLLWLEGFTVVGSPELADSLEYCAANPIDQAGTWVKAGTLAGTQGRGLPLLGAGFRLVGPLAATHRLDYAVRFLRHGDIEGQAGVLCRSSQPQDPLMAMKVAVLPR
ncbi:hypothetical protein [Nitrospirillum viridazoti]|uniref:Uncharacterized protein n=1 Tax=Nitrospirillum amazonense TaxID=28077 RepID=A0A560HXT7_9PROT|nr:hypothetical protein [Nitrospirillum amazonense]TWB51468.1 hypothetical protein FBZ92_12062 [Nitrospirillum amazonense]